MNKFFCTLIMISLSLQNVCCKTISYDDYSYKENYDLIRYQMKVMQKAMNVSINNFSLKQLFITSFVLNV